MAYPTGYTALQAVTLVQDKTNEPTIVPYATIVGYLNDGLDEVVAASDPVLTYTSIPTQATDVTVNLPQDVWDIKALFYSTVSPLTQGWVPYEVVQYDPKEFMLYTGGVPTVGGGPPFCYTILKDTAGVMTIELGSPMPGYLFLVYHQRPQLWANGNDATSQNSTTNVDTSFQRAAILYACVQVCENIENLVKAKYFQGLYDQAIEEIKGQARKRRMRHPSMVRDVTSGAASWPFPFFWPQRGM